MRAACLLLLVFLAGCVAETVERTKPRKGPVPEVGWVETGGGEVRYSTDGWGFVVGLRRHTALRKMRGVCKGLKARVTDEFTHEDVNVPYASDDLAQHIDKGVEHYEVAPYHHIVFECYEPLKLSATQAVQAQGKP